MARDTTTRGRDPLVSAPALSPHPSRRPFRLPRFGHIALTAPTAIRLQSRLPIHRLLRLDRFERRDARARGGFELFLERRLVVGNELRAVSRSTGLDVEGLHG